MRQTIQKLGPVPHNGCENGKVSCVPPCSNDQSIPSSIQRRTSTSPSHLHCSDTHTIILQSNTRSHSEPGIEQVQVLADNPRSGYVVTATKPVHRLQIHPIVHNYKAPLPFLQLTPGSVQLCENAARDRHTGRHTDTQTAVIKIHFASATLHAKCNK